MGGKKRAIQFFHEHTYSSGGKGWEKNCRKKEGKNIFYTHMNIVTKKWRKKTRNKFSRNTRKVRERNVVKIIVGKVREKLFLYSHEYRDQKMVGKKRAKQYFQKLTNWASKKCREKTVGMCEKNVFYITMNIVPKNGGKKCARQFFQKHKNSASNKCWEKNRLKKVRKNVFYIHTNIVTKKWGEKTLETISSRMHV